MVASVEQRAVGTNYFATAKRLATAVARPHIEADVFGYTCSTIADSTPSQFRIIVHWLSFISASNFTVITLVYSGLRAETGFCPTIKHVISLIPYPIILFSS